MSSKEATENNPILKCEWCGSREDLIGPDPEVLTCLKCFQKLFIPRMKEAFAKAARSEFVEISRLKEENHERKEQRESGNEQTAKG